MVAPERIEKIEASFTWPHPEEPGYYVNASFCRDNKGRQWLVYSPKAKQQISLTIENFLNDTFWFVDGPPSCTRQGILEITLTLQEDKEKVLFYFFVLEPHKEQTVKKSEIEKMFNIKVED